MTAELHHWPLTIAHVGDRGPGWCAMLQRPGTDDAAIADEIVLHDEYRLRGVDLTPQRVDAPPFEDFGEREQIVVDLGANVGFFTMTCVRMGAGRVIAVEPDAENYALLMRNVEGNRAGQKVSLVNAAVGAVRGTAFMAGVAGTAHASTTVRAGVEVEQITLTDILAPLQRVAICKLDVEGAEADILLATAHDQLAKCDRILAELHGPPACPWADPSTWGAIVHHLSETHAVSTFGRPSEGGGHLFAHSYTL